MLDTMRRKNKKCKTCSKLNHSIFVKCPYGKGEPYRFSYKDEDFELCQFGGFEFTLNNPDEREVLRKWVELECAY
jgi:hypothetical protein